MASALPVPVQNENDKIPEHLFCPICFELPKGKVFQCKKGHPLCASCYEKCKDCPNCRLPFDKSDSIRCLYFEGLVDEVIKVDCVYKLNGCNHQFKRALMRDHQSKCHFNFEKFGKLVNVCKLIGYKDCDFRFNYGNAKDAVHHFVSVHGCVQAEKDHLQMELTGIQQTTKSRNSYCYWTPTISKFDNGYLLTSAIFNRKHGSLSCFTVLIKSNEDEDMQPVKMIYSLESENASEELGFFQNAFPLSKAESLLPNNLPCSIHIRNLKSHFTGNGSLLINCIVRDCDRNGNTQERKSPERIVCINRTISTEDTKDTRSIQNTFQMINNGGAFLLELFLFGLKLSSVSVILLLFFVCLKNWINEY